MADNRTTGQPAGTQEAAGPPMPKFIYKLLNPTFKLLLRSPLHGLMSKSLMVLSFQGRKSGRRYSIPVGYLEKGGKLYLFSHTAWWKNLRGGAAVSVRLRGKEIRGRSEIVEDATLKSEIVRMLVAKNGEEMAKRMGMLGPDGSFAPAPNTVFIEITLQEPRR